MVKENKAEESHKETEQSKKETEESNKEDKKINEDNSITIFSLIGRKNLMAEAG